MNINNVLNLQWRFSARALKVAVKEKAACPECGGIIFVYDKVSGEVICSNCGLVVDVIVDASPEWRVFTVEEQARSRTGDPVSLSIHNKNLSTVIWETYVAGWGEGLRIAAGAGRLCPGSGSC